MAIQTTNRRPSDADLIREFEKRRLQRAEKRATAATRAGSDSTRSKFDRELCAPGTVHRCATQR